MRRLLLLFLVAGATAPTTATAAPPSWPRSPGRALDHHSPQACLAVHLGKAFSGARTTHCFAATSALDLESLGTCSPALIAYVGLLPRGARSVAAVLGEVVHRLPLPAAAAQCGYSTS